MLANPTTREKLRQLANPYIAEVDRRTFGLQTQVSLVRLTLVSSRNFFSVDPQPYFTIDCSDVVVVPLAESLAQILGWETSLAIWR